MKTPQNSSHPQNDLKAYLDGELPLLRRWKVQFHLRQCSTCREEVQTMTQISHDLQADESTKSLSPQLRERILENLPAARPAERQTPTKSKIPPQIWNYGLAFCLILFVGVGSLTLMGRRVSNTFNSASAQLDDGPTSYTAEDRAPIFENGNAQKGVVRGESPSAANSPVLRTDKALAENSIYKDKLTRRAAPYAGASSAAAPSSGGTSNLPAALRKVHKEGRLAVAVDDIEAQSAAAEQSVRAAGGYIVSNDLSTGTDNRKSARLDLRVPVGRFDSMVIELSGLGEVRAKQVTGEDITEQFSDSQQAKNVLTNELTTRELQLKEALARVEAAQKKKKYMADPWELRAEVRRLRVETSQVRARFELMRKLSDLSAITLDLKEKSLTPTGGFSQEMGETVRSAGDTFLVAARLPIKLFIWIFAFAPLWLPLLIAYKIFTRRTLSPLGK